MGATKAFLEQLDSKRGKLQALIQDKMSGKNLSPITDEELAFYTPTDSDKLVYQAFSDYSQGKHVPGFELKDFLGTPQAKILIPQVLIGKLRKASEIDCFVSKLYKTIPVKSSSYSMFPSVGTIRAHEVAEGQEYPEEGFGTLEHDNRGTAIKKYGLRIAYTEELLSDAEWGIVNILTEEAGKAMTRKKEEVIFNEWRKNGHTLFDNAIRQDKPEAGTTGLDFNGQLNDTISTDDLLDMIICVMNNRHIPTDLFMHPVVWPTMARNGLTGAFGQLEGATASFQLGPQSMQGRLPFAFTVNLSPFIGLNANDKTFDMYCIDRNNIGAILEREKMTIDKFTEPAVDIFNTKFKERYGVVTYDEGRGIVTAKNLSLANSYPVPNRTIVIDKPSHL